MDQHDSVGAWAKKYHLTSRALIESTLGKHDPGPIWGYVLHQLVHVGPTLERDLGPLLRIERATLSGVVATLVRKGLLTPTPDAVRRSRIPGQRRVRAGMRNSDNSIGIPHGGGCRANGRRNTPPPGKARNTREPGRAERASKRRMSRSS